jgi:hypothetical protein
MAPASLAILTRKPVAMTEDPNKHRNDPMVPEYWALGEELQERIGQNGYEHSQVDGIAVDIHDILQACDCLKGTLQSNAALEEKIESLLFELRHIRWHCDAAESYLTSAVQVIRSETGAP